MSTVLSNTSHRKDCDETDKLIVYYYEKKLLQANMPRRSRTLDVCTFQSHDGDGPSSALIHA